MNNCSESSETCLKAAVIVMEDRCFSNFAQQFELHRSIDNNNRLRIQFHPLSGMKSNALYRNEIQKVMVNAMCTMREIE